MAAQAPGAGEGPQDRDAAAGHGAASSADGTEDAPSARDGAAPPIPGGQAALSGNGEGSAPTSPSPAPRAWDALSGKGEAPPGGQPVAPSAGIGGRDASRRNASPAGEAVPHPAGAAQAGLGLRARRRWSLVILLLGMPIWIVVAVTAMNWLDARFGRQPILVELAVYIGLGLIWALPFRRVFLGVGRGDPEG